MVPGDLVGAVAEVSSLSAWSRVSIASISAFFCTKAASASSFDLVFVLRVLAIIFGLQLCLSEPMNASSGTLSQRNIDPIVLFFDLTCGATYGWRASLMIVWSLRRE